MADPSITVLRNQLLDPSSTPATAHAHLNRILAAPEFAQATRMPTIWDRWKQEFGQWLAKQVEDLFRAAAQHPTTSQVIFWSLAVAALAFIAFQLFRLWNRSSRTTRAAVPDAAGSLTPGAADWLAAANQAASDGDLNRAIQCVYWSGVSSLQQQDALPKDAVHTPRELLRSLRRSDASAPLRMLTGAVEKFWYAHCPATQDDWTACLQSVKALECKQE